MVNKKSVVSIIFSSFANSSLFREICQKNCPIRFYDSKFHRALKKTFSDQSRWWNRGPWETAHGGCISCGRRAFDQIQEEKRAKQLEKQAKRQEKKDTQHCKRCNKNGMGQLDGRLYFCVRCLILHDIFMHIEWQHGARSVESDISSASGVVFRPCALEHPTFDMGKL